MDKEELKERIKIPVLGFAAVLSSMFVFVLGLYILAIIIRFVVALG